MKRLYIFCEGPTEQGFCNQVLQPHLFPTGNGIVHTLAVGEKNHHHVFGVGKFNSYQRIRKFICNTIKNKNNTNVYYSTMLDLYGLPNDFPGKDQNTLNKHAPESYVTALENAWNTDIGDSHFISHLQLYEYETMLLADPNAFSIAFENCEERIQLLGTIAESKLIIEHINDGKDTAPSKRIIQVFPEYEGRKTSAGPDIAEYIGIEAIREKCPHFSDWLTQLERILWEKK